MAAKLDTRSDEQILLEQARYNITHYGTVKPPPEVAFAGVKKRCAHCKTEKEILSGFGLSTRPDGARRPHGWCTECRNGRTVGGTYVPVGVDKRKVDAPRFPTEFLHAMDPDEKKVYVEIYNRVAARLGKKPRELKLVK